MGAAATSSPDPWEPPQTRGLPFAFDEPGRAAALPGRLRLWLILLCAVVWAAGCGGSAGAAPAVSSAGGPAAVSVSVSSLDFGLFSAPGTIAGQATVVVRAPAGASFAVALGGGFHSNAGSRNLKRQGGAEMLAYNLYSDVLCTLPWGDSDFQGTFPGAPSVHESATGGDKTLTIYGRLAVPARAAAGSYEDNVLITVVY